MGLGNYGGRFEKIEFFVKYRVLFLPKRTIEVFEIYAKDIDDSSRGGVAQWLDSRFRNNSRLSVK